MGPFHEDRRQEIVLAILLAVVWLAGVPAVGQTPAEVAPWKSADTQMGLPLVDGIPLPTLGGMQFWADEYFFHQWRIQRNVWSDRCRLLDRNHLSHASGTYAHCRAKLDEIKAKRRLPPMRGKAVLVLHGLGDTWIATTLLCKHLERSGDYTVLNVGYPSTRRGIGEHARVLAQIIAGLRGVEEIHFVAHSLGNIVVRHYFADQTDPATGRKPDPRVRRFVMLGPPNHGSIAASSVSKNRLFATIAGRPGRQLGHEWTWLETELAVPSCEFGIIAGGLGDGNGFNPLLPGDDDGLVTLASTRLDGAADFLVVPVPHNLLLTTPSVLEQVDQFLGQGRFAEPRKTE